MRRKRGGKASNFNRKRGLNVAFGIAIGIFVIAILGLIAVSTDKGLTGYASGDTKAKLKVIIGSHGKVTTAGYVYVTEPMSGLDFYKYLGGATKGAGTYQWAFKPCAENMCYQYAYGTFYIKPDPGYVVDVATCQYDLTVLQPKEANRISLRIGTITTCSFTFAPGAPITVSKTGTASGGRIVSNPSGISCPGTCTNSFKIGSPVSFMPEEVTGSKFIAWTGCDSVEGTKCIKNIPSSGATISGKFDSVPVTKLKVVRTGHNFGSVKGVGIDCGSNSNSCENLYNTGSIIELDGMPNNIPFLSVTWRGCIPNANNPNKCSVTLTGTETIVYADYAMQSIPGPTMSVKATDDPSTDAQLSIVFIDPLYPDGAAKNFEILKGSSASGPWNTLTTVRYNGNAGNRYTAGYIDRSISTTGNFYKSRAKFDSIYGSFYSEFSNIVSYTDCNHECISENAVICSGAGYRVCGHHDDNLLGGDYCLDWSAIRSCPADKPYCGNTDATTKGCTANQCSPSGSTRCVDNTHYQSCGNYDSDSYLEWSNILSCTTGQTCSENVCREPTQPTLTVSSQAVSNSEIRLSWNSISGATYKVERSTTSQSGPWTQRANSITGTSYLDSGLFSGTRYYYRVTAYLAGTLVTQGFTSAITGGNPYAVVLSGSDNFVFDQQNPSPRCDPSTTTAMWSRKLYNSDSSRPNMWIASSSEGGRAIAGDKAMYVGLDTNGNPPITGTVLNSDYPARLIIACKGPPPTGSGGFTIQTIWVGEKGSSGPIGTYTRKSGATQPTYINVVASAS